MTSSASAAIKMQFNDEKQIDILLATLSPEAKTSASRRSSVRLAKDGLCLTVTVEAEDTVALRATLNAYLRWINSALNILEAVKEA